MRRGEMVTRSLVVVLLGAVLGAARPGEEEAIPAPLAPLEPLVGSWKGTAIPTADRIRGWPERHQWSWKFDRGVPVALTVSIEGGRVLTRALLRHDLATRQYRLEGTDTAGRPADYAGMREETTGALVLDRVGAAPDGSKERLTIRPNSNRIRYTMTVDRQAPGAPQHTRAIEAGLTKEGESFASGGTTADSPRCIVTGGAATLSISFEGKSYPLCCTGCRDEFQENPAKYVQKALSRARAGGPAPASRPTGAADDGSFDGLFAEPKAPARPPTTRPAPPVRAQTPTEPTTTAAPRDRPTTQGEPAPKPAPAAAAKAASLLRFGRALEQAGNTAGALGYYRQVVKDYPNSEPARSATARIKALDGRD